MKTANDTSFDFEWIEGMTKEFKALTASDLKDDLFYREWQLRILLAIAQQLSVISHSMKP